MSRYSLKKILKSVKTHINNSYNEKDFYTKASKLMLSSAALTTVFFAAAPAYAAVETISIGLNEYHRFNAKGSVTRVAIGNPNVADVTLLPNTNNEFLIIGKNIGSTSLLIWRGGVMDEYFISVGANDAGLAAAIQDAIGLPNVKVSVTSTMGEESEFKDDNGKTEGGISSGVKKRILLEGRVRDQIEHDRALKIASLYTGDKRQKPERRGIDDDGFEYDTAYRVNAGYENVIDLLTIEAPTQIRIEAQIVEISATDGDKLGFTYGNPMENATIGEENAFYAGESFAGNHGTGIWLVDSFAKINGRLELMMKKGKAKLLSRPSISTMSGSKAKIHIGGEIPYPKSNKNGEVSYDWKEYGIRLNIDPTVAEDESVTATVHAEVSTLDYDHQITYNGSYIPAIRSRNAHSLVHIDPGKTMVIGGLLSSDDAKVVKKVPIISSIPIIGEFFKHHSNDNEKRELIILLTPRLVSQDDPAQMSDKMQDWYIDQQYEANRRNLVDINNPELPAKVKDDGDGERIADENVENPGTRLYERWQEETQKYENGEPTEEGNIR